MTDGNKLWARCERSMDQMGDFHPIDLIDKALTEAHREGMEEAAKELLDFANEVTGFCVVLRKDHDCWESHQDVGILFAKAAAIREKIKENNNVKS